MTTRSAIYEACDVIVIPFPYTDNIAQSKRRPAVVLSDNKTFNLPTGQLICAMITSAAASRWPHDVNIHDLEAAGLDKPCVVRMKIFTIDRRFVLRKAGVLGKKDRETLGRALNTVLSLTK